MIEYVIEPDFIEKHGGVFRTYTHKMHTTLKCFNCRREINKGQRYWTKEKGKEYHVLCLVNH